MARKNSILQITLLLAGLAAVFGLYFFGKTTQPISLEQAAQAVSGQQESVDLDTEAFIAEAKKELTEEEANQLTATTKTELASFWQSIDRNDVAALVSQETAEQNGTFERWNNTGDLFIRAFREVEDTTKRIYFVQQAVFSYQKALDFQQNVNTKLKLAKTHTSLTGQTMQGVLLLREIVDVEPKHIQANYELGLLSLRSGQNEKAMERFNLLIQEEPKFIEPYILKAQLLLNDGKKEEAKDVIDAAMVNTNNQEGLAVLQEMKKRIE